jgi:adenosine deaminase
MHRFLRALCAAALLASPAHTAPPAISAAEQRFAIARKNPLDLYAFLLRMPKGGDLHLHSGGAVYAETYLRIAAEDGLCLDLRTHAVVAPPATKVGSPCGENGVEAARAQSDNTLASAMIDSLSMRNFVPGRESGHDHFFATFAKFGPFKAQHRGELLAEVVRRAAEQNESYLELMTLNGVPANYLGSRAGFSGDFAADREKLVAGGLAKVVEGMRASVDELERGRTAALQCNTEPETPACRVTVRYLYQVFRESPKEQVFAQVLAGFLLASADPRVVGINFVQPEDGATSMRDYRLQMRMVDYAHGLYPNVHITLHAGELAPGLVPPDGLRFHIRDAVELGHAERIGHGVSVMYENNAWELLDLMRRRRVLVEINLSSNDLILGVRGAEHPLPVYRKHGVPVALSTDDEGVSRIHLTEEYVRATLTYGLSYANLKEMVRNSLEYSFLPGASYWRDSSYRVAAAPCAAGEKAAPCQEFIKSSEKARLQLDLERRFRSFENSFSPQH